MGGLDGPGIRCVVFLQGCPMRCLYCHNPDTWDPAGGMEIDSRILAVLINRYKHYFGREGGVTFSGGEPFMQAAFLAETIRLCKGFGIHTAVDTGGFYLNDDVLAALTNSDLIILDIKHTDPQRHKLLTGADISRVQAFLNAAVERGNDLWIRQVIVPGWNDTAKDMTRLADIAASAGARLEKIELAAYHTMAIHKWRKLNLTYQLEGLPEPTAEAMETLSKALFDELRRKGMHARVEDRAHAAIWLD